MDLSIYFEPIDVNDFRYAKKGNQKTFGAKIIKNESENFFPNLSGVDMAIIGVGEERAHYNNEGCGEGLNAIRNYFYDLYPGAYQPRIADLGNIKQGSEINDTYFALTAVCSELLDQSIIPIVIGGSQDLTYANYRAYEDLGQIINIVTVDNQFDLGENDEDLNARSYLSKIILHQPNFLFNYTNLGYQTYFTDQDSIKLMDNLYFDTYRLGNVRANMESVEPLVRNADMMSIDISAVRQTDAPGNKNSTPNGFLGEEMCQITRYAGLSDKMTSIGFYEYNPYMDNNGQTAHLIAQMIWYFIDGYYNRMHDYPIDKKSQKYNKFMVKLSDQREELVFFKSKKSDRWWMEIECASTVKAKYERHYLVPCSYEDYSKALEDDVPERWIKAYQKLM
ncbi:MAG: arginase [Bacteroidetes bacterium 4572_77]|nr:MAG: arginase [Bacteroidetes bacterium 4572_77]